MNVGKAIYYLLANNANVSAITTRIYPEFAPPDATTPFIAYTITNVQPDDTHDGPAVIDEVRMDVICVDDTYDGAADLASVVRVALDRVYGTYNTVNVESIQFTDANIEVRDTPRQYGQDLTFIVRVKRDDVQIATGSPIEALNLWRLADVDDNIVNALDRQALVYDEATSQWIADGVGQVVIPVRNPSRDPIAIGTVLKATGAQGDRILVAPFNADLDDPRYLVGIASEELGATAETKDGHAQVYGELRNIDTDAYEVGDILYPDSTGALVTTENQYPIAIVLRKQQNTGRIFIRTWTPGRSRYDADVETLRQEMDTSLANADIELYFSAQADGYGLVESPGSDSVVNSTPAEDYQVERAIFYNNTGLASYVSDSGWSTLTTNTESYAAAKARVEDYIRGGTYGKLPCTFAIVRTEETVRTGLLVDYPGAAAAYSLRLLDTDYTGSAIRVRRASDNAEQDIGFDGNGDLDTAALATFCSGTDGFVKTWYDQSGNANDATQTVTGSQPKVYDNSTGIITEGSYAAIDWASSSMTMPASVGVDFSIAWVWRSDNAGLNQLILNTQVDCYWNPSNVYRLYFGGTIYNFGIGEGAVLPTTYSVVWQNYSTSETWYMRSNGNEKSFAAGASYTPASGSIGQGVDGRIQEMIIWNSNESTNRTGIESNINNAYAIYGQTPTGLLADYPGAAAAYSVRQLISTAHYAMAVRRASDNAVLPIGFVNGDLDTATLAAFCSGTDGFVAVWYDQSGNSNDATQTTTSSQPKIYDSSTGVVTENGKPAVTYTSGTGVMLQSANFASPYAQPTTFFAIGASGGSGGEFMISGGSPSTLSQVFGTRTTTFQIFSGTSVNTSTSIDANQHLWSIVFDDPSSNAWQDGSQVVINQSSGTNTISRITLFNLAYSPTLPWKGVIQEFVFYNSNQSSNRAGIESNINTYYSIYP